MAWRPRYLYIGSCVTLDGASILAMRDGAREISLSEFSRAVDPGDWCHMQRVLGYSKLFRIENDWHVWLGRSVYAGRPCVYLVHSGIEYVFAGDASDLALATSTNLSDCQKSS